MLAHELGMTVPTEHARLRQASVRGLDFIVIGAQKAGTSSLFEHLRSHPELYIPPHKEYPFFSHDERYAVGWSAFLSRAFLGAPAGTSWGTVTPWYMSGCPVRVEQGISGEPLADGDLERIIPNRIRARIPDVRLIAVLRDPVSRCVSHYGMDVLRGVADRGGFDRTIRDLLSSAALESSRRLEAPSYIAWGEYGRILKAFYDVFPREQIYVCFTSDLEHAPREFMRRLFEYLGVDRSFVPARLRRRYRQAAASPRIGRLPSPAALERKLARQRWARALWRLLPPGVQTRALLRSRGAGYRLQLWNRRGGGFNRREASPEVLDLLDAHYAEDRILLEELIGKPVPWRAVPLEE